MRLFCLFAAALLAAAGSFAHADTIKTYSFLGANYLGGGNERGTVTIDTMTGTPGDVELIFTDGPLQVSELGDLIPGTGMAGGLKEYSVSTAEGDFLLVSSSMGAMLGFESGRYCGFYGGCGRGGYMLVPDYSREDFAAVAPAPTPEPSSLMLVATGVLGALGAMAFREKALQRVATRR